MSFFNKVLASVGIGSASVDTKLSNAAYSAGDKIEGIVEVRGGNIAQQIDAIYLSLMTTYEKEHDDRKYTKSAVIEQFRVNDPFEIGVNETKEIPFSFVLPLDTPVSLGKTRVWVQTGVDIKNAIDPSDRDFIEIKPSKLVNEVLRSIQHLGFRLREVECEEASYRIRQRLPFIQEFEFVPTSGSYRGRLDELEVMFFPQSYDSLELVLQVDRRARGLGGFLAEAFEMDESLVRMTINTHDLGQIEQKLNDVIRKYS
ncbi:sporulation protein SpoOM [Bacillus sp. HMF5848]|uniref:sporulation protein n=1 Tax=Bacillus sp. HMF5848 TaxID=2495421 RepID=UPI000F7B493A|nr:sporulation protein [Bacillus sp. HMF5848]RSK27272.1 sporulation protein SpoOM [Bacillus sp. HMF5848]